VGVCVLQIIGWGVEKGEHYWLVVNSWNDTWGESKWATAVRECNWSLFFM
jgi:hypothetical protein